MTDIGTLVVGYCIVSGTELTRPALRMKLGPSKQCACIRVYVSKQGMT